ncbi:hypothetical protein [Streptomyces sp. CT34]|uniref:hypothetical protein n=1 Tax=Streptomyces sp. CT34 TaxID=1553907 RepID=UPI0005BE10DD|nr:hypothetical protein [Streptomyces sp. CT34]
MNTVTVWVWKDRYGGLRAADQQSRPEASVRHVPLPDDTGSLQRLYGNLTRMIAEREAAGGPVHTNRGTLPVRLWETRDGDLTASLTRRKGTTVAALDAAGRTGAVARPARQGGGADESPRDSPAAVDEAQQAIIMSPKSPSVYGSSVPQGRSSRASGSGITNLLCDCLSRLFGRAYDVVRGDHGQWLLA